MWIFIIIQEFQDITDMESWCEWWRVFAGETAAFSQTLPAVSPEPQQQIGQWST